MFLKSTTTLVNLDLSMNGLWSETAQAFYPGRTDLILAEALKENRTLKRLNLAQNDIGVEGVQARQRLGIGPEELTWYSSPIAAAWGKDCALLLGVRQLQLLNAVEMVPCAGFTDNSTCVLCRFLISPLTVCFPSALTLM